MFARYKEIWYGVLFGIGAIGIDLVMHARMQKRDFSEELFAAELETIVYRAMFLAFGVALGWLLWHNSRREREFRKMQDHMARLQGQALAAATLAYAKLQIILTRTDNSSSSETLSVLHAMRDDLLRLKSLVDADANAESCNPGK